MQITLEDNSVFSVLAVAEELGVTHLKHACQQNIEAALSVSNACGFYAAALQTEDELKYHGKGRPNAGVSLLTDSQRRLLCPPFPSIKSLIGQKSHCKVRVL